MVPRNQIQLRASVDDQGRRYMVLDHLSPHQDYTATCINDGREFAIGGSVDYICKNLKDQIAKRESHARLCDGPVETWHVVAIPNSNMTDAPIFPPRDRAGPSGLRLPHPYRARSPQQVVIPKQEPDNNDQQFLAALPQHNPGNNNLQTGFPQYPVPNQQPMFSQHNTVGSFGPFAFPPAQQMQYASPVTGAFNQGGRSATMFPQGQSQFQGSQQGQGYNQFTGMAQGNYQNNFPGDYQNNFPSDYQNNLPGDHQNNFPGTFQNNLPGDYPGDYDGSYMENYQDDFPGQNNTRMFNDGGGSQVGYLPQVHRPVFDRQGNIIGQHGNVYDHSQAMPYQGYQQQVNQYQPAQYPTPNNPQLANSAQSFYNFCEDKRAFGQGVRPGQVGGNNNANPMGTVDSDGGKDDQGDAVDPSDPCYHLIRACKDEPHRFADQTGSNVCDNCGRDGHEAVACIAWDPVHFDKGVCTACNNVQHSLDECPKFRAMRTAQKQALLLGAGAGRPGVRSVHHAWTSYVHRDYRGPGFPLTRQALRDISADERLGPVLRNMWKVWNYNRGVPGDFRDRCYDSVRVILHTGLDETFRGDDGGKEGDEMQS
ncbi:hypothetical protein Daus18300_003807 [Diaporthe australafricana]|uniref:Zinc knuckle domain-containing protein n=1 Tax=Diaporthe australafricana TaxID=127596 RepID=A0ABR3XDS5_9PEZI